MLYAVVRQTLVAGYYAKTTSRRNADPKPAEAIACLALALHTTCTLPFERHTGMCEAGPDTMSICWHPAREASVTLMSVHTNLLPNCAQPFRTHNERPPKYRVL